MDDSEQVDSTIWQVFLSRHIISEEEQELFLDYLTGPTAPSVDTLPDLEDAYRRFLRRGSPPIDIH